jgi:hypothetical protein
LKSLFQQTAAPPPVWAYVKGTVQGIALAPLHKLAPKAALADPRLHQPFALLDALRGNRICGRRLAGEEITKRLTLNA